MLTATRENRVYLAYPCGGYFYIMAYNIIGSITYSSAANRTTAETNVINALSAYSWTGVATSLAAGVTNNGNATLNISVQVPDASANAAILAVRAAWQTAARATTGHWISAVKA